MDILFKFPDEATALEYGKGFGLYVEVPDDPIVEVVTEQVIDELDGETCEVEREVITPQTKWVRNTSNYGNGHIVCAAERGVHWAPNGDLDQQGNSILQPVEGWWVLIRTDFPLSDELGTFAVWNSESDQPYPDDPDIPKMAFA